MLRRNADMKYISVQGEGDILERWDKILRNNVERGKRKGVRLGNVVGLPKRCVQY